MPNARRLNTKQSQCTDMSKFTKIGEIHLPPASKMGRRQFLLTSMAAGAAACAAPPPEVEFDPSELVYPRPPEQPRYYFERTIWGSNDVVQETRTDRLRRFATGESVRGQGFSKPFDVAAFGGRLYISDTVSLRVHVLDFPRSRYYVIGLRGVGRLSRPLGLAADATGKTYVCDGSAKRVNIYDLEGNYLDAIVLEGHVDNPTDVAVSNDGSLICVVDTGTVRSSHHGLALFDNRGTLVRQIRTRGVGPAEFNLPLSADIGPDGRIYALDTGNFRVQILDGEGNFISQFGEAGRYPGQFGHPRGIAVSESGRIYISDTNFGLFQIFNLEGRILMSVGERDEAGGFGKFILPAGIAADIDERVYVIDQFFRKVEVFRPVETAVDWPIGEPLVST